MKFYYSIIFLLFIDQAAHGQLNIGDRSQLFLDHSLIASTNAVIYTLESAQKHVRGPWLKGSEDGPVGCAILFDEEEKLYKSWSTGGDYNTSKDGLHWSKKDAGDASWFGIRRVSVIKDVRDRNVERRYKFLAFSPSGESSKEVKPGIVEDKLWYLLGYNTYFSPDGRVLTHLSQKHLLYFNNGNPMNERISGYFDQVRGVYVAFPKTERLKVSTESSKVKGQRYAFSQITSKDFETWSAPRLMLLPDELDDCGAVSRLDEVAPLLVERGNPDKVKSQIYATGGTYQTGNFVLLFYWMLTMSGFQDDGPSEVQVTFTRDLETWQRPFRKPIIPRGKVDQHSPAGSDEAYGNSDWDSCWFNAVSSGFDVGDEVWVYYSACNTPHHHPATFGGNQLDEKKIGPVFKKGIGLATWKHDRFASVDSIGAPGILTTVPLIFSGNILELNGLTHDDGEITVELLDEKNQVLGRSNPFKGNDIHHRVAWKEPLDLKAWNGKPVQLRFKLDKARIFSFSFKS